MIHQTFNRITTSLILFLLFAFTLTTTVGAANHSPYRPSNPYPIDSATYINTTVTLIWQGGDPNPEDSVVYDVYFGTRYPPPKVSRKQLNTSYHVDNLRYNTVYYWLIVSRDNQGSATAGPLWRFTTRPIPNNPPQQPHSPTPAHQEQNIATPMQLSWECSDQNGDTLYYDIFLEANDTTPDSTLVTNHPYKEISSGILAYNTTYYWQVVATDTHDATNESAIWEFTTGGKNANHPPSEPSNPTPPHQGTNIIRSSRLSWSCTDQDNDTITYSVYFGTNSSPKQVVDNQTHTSYTPPILSYDTTYYWQIEAYDEHGAYNNGSLWSFTTEEEGANHPPETPHSPSPTNGKSNVYINPLLQWDCNDPDGDRLTYELYLGTSSDDLDLQENDIPSSQYQLNGLTYNTQYFWKVTAIDAHNAEKTGPVWSFITVSTDANNPPHTPSSPSPDNGQVGVATNVKLTWNGGDPDSGDSIKYTIYFGTNKQPPMVAEDLTNTEYHPGKISFDTTYYWKVKATDNHGLSSTSTKWMFTTKEGNEHPLVDAGGPYHHFVDERITFDGSGSTDPDGTLVGFRWDFGDSSYGTGEVTHHIYTTAGSYQVTLTVVDDDGREVTDTVTATIKQANFAPGEPTIEGPTTANAGEPLTYTISAQDKDGDLIQFFINWGDGTTTTSDLVLSSTEVEHIWSNQGLYSMKVSAEDENGGRSTVEELRISIGVKVLELNFPLHFLFGYLIDYDNDGVYDVFQRNDKRETPILYTEEGHYLIDENDDGEWDYTYDPYSKTLDDATSKDINQSEANAGFFLFSEDFIIFFPILIIGGLIIGIEVAIVSYTRRKKKMH